MSPDDSAHDREVFSTGTAYEEDVGYARAVRKGPIATVSGTVAVEDGEVVGASDPYEQTRFILDRIASALDEVGASLEDVIHTRMYLQDFSYWRPIATAHEATFGDVRPANTTVQVDGLVSDEFLVEIDAQAVVTD